jgi:hypothetical protein
MPTLPQSSPRSPLSRLIQWLRGDRSPISGKLGNASIAAQSSNNFGFAAADSLMSTKFESASSDLPIKL